MAGRARCSSISIIAKPPTRTSDAAPMGWIVENRFLRAALLRRLAACPQVELVAPDEVIETRRDPDRAELALKSGRRLADAAGRLGRGPLRHHARGGRHRRARLVVRPDRDRAGGAPRAAASRRRPGEVPARRTLRHPADARWRERRASLVDRLERARRPGASACSSSTRRASRPSSRAASATISATSSRPARAGGIRSAWSMPSATSTRAWCWWATPRTASIPSRAKAITSACATSRPWSRC